ncbi:hypothetical protein HMN09_01381200 [Mycena chlorophos]|uniref:NADH dehydrogenase [ubiquinone] iron-sulfur protein 4, mitochondrial n=1 Tax=Mycena chlorophos TaxID=658473 RepID=A0A8H6RYB8_MYCCL|nr:hypothetical protein HMN09_01381200 [Mycena chlorophos]
MLIFILHACILPQSCCLYTLMLSRTYRQAAGVSRRAAPSLVGIRAASDSATSSPPVDATPASDIVPVPTQEVFTADVVSGAPSQLRHRAVRVYQATRNTMQSGGAKGERWRIDFDILQGGARWENPLMGYASSADYMQGTRMSFKSQEDAIHFAKKQGWDYYVQAPTVKRIPPKNYSENYLYNPNKLRIHKTK